MFCWWIANQTVWPRRYRSQPPRIGSAILRREPSDGSCQTEFNPRHGFQSNMHNFPLNHLGFAKFKSKPEFNSMGSWVISVFKANIILKPSLDPFQVMDSLEHARIALQVPLTNRYLPWRNGNCKLKKEALPLFLLILIKTHAVTIPARSIFDAEDINYPKTETIQLAVLLLFFLAVRKNETFPLLTKRRVMSFLCWVLIM